MVVWGMAFPCFPEGSLPQLGICLPGRDLRLGLLACSLPLCLCPRTMEAAAVAALLPGIPGDLVQALACRGGGEPGARALSPSTRLLQSPLRSPAAGSTGYLVSSLRFSRFLVGLAFLPRWVGRSCLPRLLPISKPTLASLLHFVPGFWDFLPNVCREKEEDKMGVWGLLLFCFFCQRKVVALVLFFFSPSRS